MLYELHLKPFREQKFMLSFYSFTYKVCTYASTAFFKYKKHPERRKHYTQLVKQYSRDARL